MTFDEVLERVIVLLQREGRVTYRALKRRFDLDDEYVEDLKDEIIEAKRVAVDENGKVLVWMGATPVSRFEFQVSSSEAGSQSPAPNNAPPLSQDSALRTQHGQLVNVAS